MKLVAGVKELDIPGLFAGARRRIILHAAVYGPFSKSEIHRQALKAALIRPDFKQLDIIAVESGCKHEWSSSFCNALRFGISRQSVEDEINLSSSYLQELTELHPEKVNVFPAYNLPCLPVVIVDNIINFGQYAHAPVHAPDGFWGTVEADVEKLLLWAESGVVPSDAIAEEISAFRLVNECARAMKPCPVAGRF